MDPTPEELKALQAISKAQADGQDPFGDDEPLTTAQEETQEETPGNEGQETGDEGDESTEGTESQEAASENGTGEELDQAALEEIAANRPPASEAPASFKAELPADFKEQRTKLQTEKAGLMKKLMDGEIDAEQYAGEEARIQDALDDLTAARIRAETLNEANQQTQAQYQQREIQRLIARTKDEINYAADPKAQKQFDTALAIVVSDPDNAGIDFADALDQAHRTVAALRGVQVQAKPSAPSAAPRTARTPDGKPPVTLRGVPAAATPNSNGGIPEQLARLSGVDYEDAFSRLSPAQRAALLDEE